MTIGKRVVIVGGGPAGMAAARGYRDAGGRGSVVIITDGDDVRDVPPAVDVVHGWAVELDVSGRCVRLADGRALEYDGCVLATGAEPEHPTVAGALLLRSVPGALDLVAEAGTAAGVTVIGTEFLGCETAASLAMQGADVTLVGSEHVPQLRRLGPEAGERIATWLVDLGVELRMGVEVEQFPADGVVLQATDTHPRIELAADAGLRLSTDREAIATDVCLRTTGDHVFAAGDACEAVHPIVGRPLRVEHPDNALEQGTVVGRQLAGEEDARWEDVPGFQTTIGPQSLKYAGWGNGFEDGRLVDHDDGSWTVWYTNADGACVGVLAHDRDEDYARGRELVAAGALPS
jgi:NADPH-dependent 2,4-dienoyl-CoA reductase/sulfur reductase-like enzyme